MLAWRISACALAVLKQALISALISALIPAAAAAADCRPAQALTADQVIARNIEARGGLDAWRKVETVAWSGRIEAGSMTEALPFLMEFKRPNKSRFEMLGQGDRSVRVFDGARGWNVRTTDTGARVLRPYSVGQLRSAREAPGIDGPLVDYQARGIGVSLVGTEDVDGHPAYRLNVVMPSRSTHQLWIDSKSFLEVKSKRELRIMRGRSVEVHYRNYRRIGGLMFPTLIESTLASGATVEKVTIDDVTLNLRLSDARFGRPTDLGRPVAPRGWKQTLESADP